MSETVDEIRKGLAVLFRAGDVVEMRVPRKHEVEYSSSMSGFFNDMDKLALAIDYVNTKYKSTVYVTMNPLRSSWMAVNNKAYIGSKAMRDELMTARAPMEPRMKKSVFWETGRTHYTMRMAEDEDVLKRRWILIDIDAGQPANTNSSDAEHANTLAMAKAVVSSLQARGFPEPALTNSGNGHHVYVRVDLENNAESAFLVRRFLKSLAQQFNGKFGTAMVDEGMFNAGRITKAAGSMVFKGVDSPERPCRRSHVISMASNRFAVLEQIVEVAEEYVFTPGDTLNSFSGGDAVIEGEWLEANYQKLTDVLEFYGIEYKEAKQDADYITLPCTCPNATEHSMDGGEMECVAGVRLSGGYMFCCMHAHCQQLRSWKGFLKFMEEKTGDKFFDDNDKGTGVLYLNGCLLGDGPQQSIVAAPSVTKHEMAVKLLKELCVPACTVPEAKAAAAKLDISERILRDAYQEANVVSVWGQPVNILTTV